MYFQVSAQPKPSLLKTYKYIPPSFFRLLIHGFTRNDHLGPSLSKVSNCHVYRPTPTPQAFDTSFYAIIDADSYVLPLIHSALSKSFPRHFYKYITSTTQLPHLTARLLQITPYESIDFTHVLEHPTTSLANSYIIRKALIRKNYLHNTVTSWWSKHPNDTDLKSHVPLTVAFEVDYAEFLDEALVECWELYESFAKEQPEWWVLKPGMSDQGQGIRLFSSEKELQAIFEEWEGDESDDEDETETPPNINGLDVIGAGTMTSQLRHFIAQRYIHPPLLLKDHGNRKFHIRCYVLAVGALRAYVYEDMLALFAPDAYTPPSIESLNPRIHLTNTCLQDGSREAIVLPFWDLSNNSSNSLGLAQHWKESIFNQICAATGTLFEAAAREQMIHFQTLENAFEVFGVDWMVDAGGRAWLLEVNAFPDFRQSGSVGEELVKGFWEEVIGVAVGGFFGGEMKTEEDRLRKVLDVDLGRR